MKVEIFEKYKKYLETNGWSFVKMRKYQKVFIFKNQHKKIYLQIGDPLIIKQIIEKQTTLYKKKYPVSPLLKTGKTGNFFYLLEMSLGDETYGDIFAKKIESHIFKSFCRVIKIYFEAQLKNQLIAPIDFNIRKEVLSENVIQENSDLDEILINSALDKLQRRFQSIPFTYSHGDFAARNVLNKGVIDFEFYSIAPIGLDVFTVLIMEDFWMFKNETGEFQAKFYFNQEEKEYLLKVLKKICRQYNLNKLTEYQNDFILFKAFWSMAYEKQQSINSGNETKWRFRRSIFMHCIEKYLKGENIDTSKFKSLSKI